MKRVLKADSKAEYGITADFSTRRFAAFLYEAGGSIVLKAIYNALYLLSRLIQRRHIVQNRISSGAQLASTISVPLFSGSIVLPSPAPLPLSPSSRPSSSALLFSMISAFTSFRISPDSRFQKCTITLGSKKSSSLYPSHPKKYWRCGIFFL